MFSEWDALRERYIFDQPEATLAYGIFLDLPGSKGPWMLTGVDLDHQLSQYNAIHNPHQRKMSEDVGVTSVSVSPASSMGVADKKPKSALFRQVDQRTASASRSEPLL